MSVWVIWNKVMNKVLQWRTEEETVGLKNFRTSTFFLNVISWNFVQVPHTSNAVLNALK